MLNKVVLSSCQNYEAEELLKVMLLGPSENAMLAAREIIYLRDAVEGLVDERDYQKSSTQLMEADRDFWENKYKSII